MRLFIISLFLLYWTEFCKVRAEKNISFWQITDIHYDKFYMYHGNKAESCHGINGSAEKFGEYSCEAGKDLFISSVKGLNISKGIFYSKRKIVVPMGSKCFYLQDSKLVSLHTNENKGNFVFFQSRRKKLGILLENKGI